MPLGSVSPSFCEWTLPVPRDWWDPQDPKFQVAVRPYVYAEKVLCYTLRDKLRRPVVGTTFHTVQGFLAAGVHPRVVSKGLSHCPGLHAAYGLPGRHPAEGNADRSAVYGTIYPLTPKVLHETRKRLEGNRFLGYVVVRNGMHKLIRSHYRRAELAHRSIRDETGEWNVFEALTAAVCLNSDQYKSTVWRSFFPLLRSQFNIELQKTATIANRTYSSSTSDSESSED
ncbi:hypothetical protein MRX96_034157 [Rhipicephalus microplus]